MYQCFSHSRISISELAKCMGIKAIQIHTNDQMNQISDFVSGLRESCVVELVIDGNEPPPIVGRLKALKQFSEN